MVITGKDYIAEPTMRPGFENGVACNLCDVDDCNLNLSLLKLREEIAGICRYGSVLLVCCKMNFVTQSVIFMLLCKYLILRQ